MPERKSIKRAKQDIKEGKAPSTAAGEFVHEEIEHVRKGKHGARSPQQAIAIGLSNARRAGIPVAPPKKGNTKKSTREKAKREQEQGSFNQKHAPSSRASRARKRVLQKEPHSSASYSSLSKHAHASSHKRTAEERHEAAMKAVRTKGQKGLHEAAEKAALTRSHKKAA